MSEGCAGCLVTMEWELMEMTGLIMTDKSHCTPSWESSPCHHLPASQSLSAQSDWQILRTSSVQATEMPRNPPSWDDCLYIIVTWRPGVVLRLWDCSSDNCGQHLHNSTTSQLGDQWRWAEPISRLTLINQSVFWLEIERREERGLTFDPVERKENTQNSDVTGSIKKNEVCWFLLVYL